MYISSDESSEEGMYVSWDELSSSETEEEEEDVSAYDSGQYEHDNKWNSGVGRNQEDEDNISTMSDMELCSVDDRSRDGSDE